MEAYLFGEIVRRRPLRSSVISLNRLAVPIAPYVGTEESKQSFQKTEKPPDVSCYFCLLGRLFRKLYFFVSLSLYPAASNTLLPPPVYFLAD